MSRLAPPPGRTPTTPTTRSWRCCPPGGRTSPPSRSPSWSTSTWPWRPCRRASRPTGPPVPARARHLVPVAAAAAFLVLVGGGVSIGSASDRARQHPVAGVEGAVQRARRVRRGRRAGVGQDRKRQEGPHRRAAAGRGRRAPAGSEGAQRGPAAGGAGPARRREELPRRQGGGDPDGHEGRTGHAVEDGPGPADPGGGALSQAPAATGTVTPTPTTDGACAGLDHDPAHALAAAQACAAGDRGHADDARAGVACRSDRRCEHHDGPRPRRRRAVEGHEGRRPSVHVLQRHHGGVARPRSTETS